MSHDETESQFAELEAQIRAALDPPAAAGQLDRLERFWQARSRADRRRQAVRRIAALAAVLLVGLAVAWLVRRNAVPFSPRPDLAAHDEVRPSAAPDSIVQQQPVAAPESADQPSVSHGRPATAYEQLMFRVRQRQREVMKQGPIANAVEAAIACLVADPQADLHPLLQSPEMNSVYVEPLLLQRLPRADDQRAMAILRLLAARGTPRSTVPLLQLSRRETCREPALQTLETLVGTDGLAWAVVQAEDPAVRSAIYRRLWGNVDTVDTCLSLVQDDMLCDEVLAAADEVEPPVRDVLLARLDAEDPAVRLAAALGLGHINEPVVSERLIRRVSQDPACHPETWIALMACRGQEIDQFLAFATAQPRLLGSLNRARVYWARITN